MSKVLKNHHLTISVAEDGSVNLKWDWDALLNEVIEATAIKKSLIKETEKKVTKTRKKK